MAILSMTGHFIAFDGKRWTDSGMHAKKKKIYLNDDFPKPKSQVISAIYITDHNIVEPEVIVKPKSTCFADLIEYYAKPEVKNEIQHHEEFVEERIDNIFGDLTYNKLSESEVHSKYLETFSEHEPKTCNIFNKDHYLWNMFMDVCESTCISDEAIRNTRTISMLNGKHQFIKLQS